MQITMNDMAVINQVFSAHKDDKMPIKVAYKFNKILKSTEEDIKFFQEKYREILFKYCQKQENGNLFIDEKGNFIVDKENTEAYTKEMNDLLTTKIDIPDTCTFNLDELDNLELTLQEVNALDSLIK